MFLTNDNYFSREANWEYWSVSQFKNFLDCEARALAELKGEWIRESSDDMLMGSYVDAYVEGTLLNFQEKHPEIYNSKKKDEKVLLAKFQQCEDIARVIDKDAIIQKYLTGDKQTIMTANLFGVDWKIKMDCYNENEGFISDLKIVESLTKPYWNNQDRRYVNFIEHWKYDLQLNIYALIEQTAMGRYEPLDTYIVAVSKETPADKGVFSGFNQEMDNTIALVESKIWQFDQIKKGEMEAFGCGKCDYCRSIKKTQVMDYHEIII